MSKKTRLRTQKSKRTRYPGEQWVRERTQHAPPPLTPEELGALEKRRAAEKARRAETHEAHIDQATIALDLLDEDLGPRMSEYAYFAAVMLFDAFPDAVPRLGLKCSKTDIAADTVWQELRRKNYPTKDITRGIRTARSLLVQAYFVLEEEKTLYGTPERRVVYSTNQRKKGAPGAA